MCILQKGDYFFLHQNTYFPKKRQWRAEFPYVGKKTEPKSSKFFFGKKKRELDKIRCSFFMSSIDEKNVQKDNC